MRLGPANWRSKPPVRASGSQTPKSTPRRSKNSLPFASYILQDILQYVLVGILILKASGSGTFELTGALPGFSGAQAQSPGGRVCRLKEIRTGLGLASTNAGPAFSGAGGVGDQALAGALI